MINHLKEYIKEHMTWILALAVMLTSSGVVIASNELIAKMLPDAAELALVSCEMEEGGIYEYTGQKLEPQIIRLAFKNADGEEIVKESADIYIKAYNDNAEIGTADVEVSLKGFRREVVLDDVFRITLGQVNELTITKATRSNIDLSWGKVIGADGYLVYRSLDNGKNYKEVQKIEDGTLTTWQDKDIRLDSVYLYKVCAYKVWNEETIVGNESKSVLQKTPLETAKLTGVINASHNTLKVEWKKVKGAAGYQVYRSKAKGGEYECIKEIKDGSVTAYNDSTCELGKPYYYYVKAIQDMGDTLVYGEASNIRFEKTTPNRVGLNGKTTEDDTKVTLKWKKSSGATGYEIYRSKNNTSNYSLVQKIESADTLTWSQSGLDKETVYFYRIRPYSVVNGTTITGSYSGAYEKHVTYVYDGPELSGEVSALTKYAGYRYRYGGTQPGGWDCSGFVRYVYKKHFGISLPRTAAQQSGVGTKISKNNRSSWEPGDLIFYRTSNGSGHIGHVGIYLGNGQMIHALSERHGTLVQSVDTYESWDQNSMCYLKRILN